jgi:hypothetical protein
MASRWLAAAKVAPATNPVIADLRATTSALQTEIYRYGSAGAVPIGDGVGV